MFDRVPIVLRGGICVVPDALDVTTRVAPDIDFMGTNAFARGNPPMTVSFLHRWLLALLMVAPIALTAQTPARAIAVVRHAPAINGTFDGSIQQLLGEPVTLDTGARITRDLLVPGTPAVVAGPQASYAGTVDGSGSTTPSGYQISLNGNAAVRNVVQRTDPVSFPTVTAPATPAGTRIVTIAVPTDSPGSFATLRDLTLKKNAGQIAVPAGAYGNFTADSGSGLTLGMAGAKQPAVYSFQQLILTGTAKIQLVGPAVVTLGGGLTFTGSVGAGAHPQWLQLNLAAGDLTIGGGGILYGVAVVPAGTATINNGGRLVGGIVADRLAVNAGATVTVVSPNRPPTVALVTPSHADLFSAPATITLRAVAADPDGTIARVEFYKGTAKIGQALVAPYQFNWTGVAAGNYTLTAKATDNAGAATVSDPVAVSVNSPPKVTLTAPKNGAVATAPATIALRATASDTDGTIAKVEFFNGTTLVGSANVAPYQFNWTGVTAGTYVIAAKATDNAGATTSSAAATVIVKNPPGVVLTSPASGTVVTVPASVTLRATATTTTGTIAKVEFYRGTTKIGESTGAPYAFTWSGMAAGTYSLTAKATDNNGVVATSAPATLIVNAPPTITISSPLNGAVVNASTTILVKAAAADAGGAVAKVEFFNGATKLGEATKAPYQVAWIGAAPGTYSLTARATDNYGAATTSAAVSVTVNALPQVALTSPITGTVVTAPGSATLQATASDSDGTVAKVEFFDGKTKLGESATAPYQFNWTNIAAGTHTLTAKATDNRGGAATSAPVTLISNAPPGIKLTLPVNNAVFTAPAAIVIKVSASDVGGTVAKVEFFNGATKLGESTVAPFSFTWSGVAAGSYALTAKATDNQGAPTTSAAVNVLVNAPPAVAITAPPDGSIVTAPASFALQANATDTDGTIAKVEFFRGATKLGESTSAPYQFAVANAAVGTYVYTAKATDNLGASTKSAAVTVNVNALPTVKLTSPTATQKFVAPATIALKASASDLGGAIARVEYFSGATKLGEATKSPYLVTWPAVPAGTYSLTAKATDNLGTSTTSAALSVLVNAAPTVTLTAPASGTVVTAPTVVSLAATASDSDGTIAKVEFFRGTTKIGQALAAPYQLNWTPPAGTYTLTAKATDDQGAVTVSAPATLVVNALPTVKITTPVANAKFTAPAAIAIAANASDSDGTITKVEFFSGTTKIGEAATPPYQFNWTDVPVGNYSLTAKATDNQGAIATSTAVAIKVTAGTGTPTITVTAPPDNAVVPASTSLTLSAATSGFTTTIAKVEFFNGATKLGDAAAVAGQPGTYSLTLAGGLAAGTYSITARATDSANAVTNSAASTLIVNAAPTVSLTAPAPGAVFPAPGAFTLAATAADSDGTIAKVEFFNGATKLGEAAAAPYQLAVSDLATGSYTFTARAMDNRGAVTTSAAVTILVNSLPTVALTAPDDGSVLAAGTDVVLQATAADADGTIAKVQFFNGATKLGEATAPYKFTWTAVPAGIYTITATAIDDLGGATTSAPIAITLDVPPTVALISPANNSVSVASAVITLAANATDSDGTVAKVEFFQGTTKLGEAASAPYQFIWSGMGAGTYSLTAVATDNLGLTATSAPVTVSVDVAPTNSLTVNGGSPTITAGTGVPLVVSTADSASPIGSVEFYRDGTLIATVTTPSAAATYTFTDPAALAPGVYIYRTHVIDTFGFVTDSGPVAVTVLAGLPYVADFEAASGYVLGSLNGQLGWTVSQGSAVITDQIAYSGARSVTLQPGTVAQVEQAFGQLAGQSIVFADFYTKPQVETDVTAATLFDAGSARLGFVLNAGGLGALQAFNGDGHGGGTWVPVNFTFPLGTGHQSQNWLHLTVRVDFARKTWDLYAGGKMVAFDLGFRDNTSAYLDLLALQGHATAPTQFDDFLAGPDNPLFVDANANGIDDAWELAHGLSLANNNRSLTPAGGGTVIQAYVNGTDPNDYYGGQAPALTILSGDGQVTSAGQFNQQPMVVLVQAGDGTPLANAPVTFFVTQGGGAVGAAPSGTPSGVLSVRTGADGTALAYYQHPAMANATSRIRATAGTAQVEFTTATLPAGTMAIAAGGTHTVALENDGTVWTWGNNSNGQLGNGTTVGGPTPGQVPGLTGVVAIAPGESHTLALLNDGTVWAWGYNGDGELGDGTMTDRWSPVPVPGLAGVAAISAGSGFSVALKSDGTVWTWGYNADGELGNNDTANSLSPVPVTGLTGIVAVDAGALHALALKSDGTVWAWGFNGDGELGNGQATNSLVPTQVTGLTGVTAISAGASHSLAVKTDGTVWAWGSNLAGQLGLSDPSNQLAPVQVSGLSGVTAVSAGGAHSLALTGSRTVFGWGANSSGQLANPNRTTALPPAPIPGATGIFAISAGDADTILLKTDGTVLACGDNTYGQLGADASPVSLPAIAIAGGGYHRLVVTNDGQVWGSWLNASGQLGDGTLVDRTGPVMAAGVTGIAAVAAGSEHSLAVAQNGTVMAWGDNGYGQLGDGTTTTQSFGVFVGGVTGIKAVAAGGYHSLAVGYDGTVWSWGANAFGQLGDGSTTARSTAASLSGVNGILGIAAGTAHSLAVRLDGTVWSWGRNASGQLGDGSLVDRATPAQISGLTGIVAVAAGADFSVALQSDGTVWTWGNNASGQLGDGTTVSRAIPGRVPGLGGIAAVAAGAAHALAVRNDGSIVAWGSNANKQLGDGTTINRLAPQAVPGIAGAKSIAAGAAYSLVLLADGSVRDFGNNHAAFANFFSGVGLGVVPIQLVAGSSGAGAGSDTSFVLPSNGYQSGMALVLSVVGGNNQFGVVGRFDPAPFTVSVWNSAGTSPLANVPVTFTVTGSGQLAPANSLPATLANAITVTTRSDGTALVFFQQPATANATGYVTASAPGAQASFTTTSCIGALAAKNSHALLVRADGTVWAWGDNGDGELGDGTTNPRLLPVQVGGLGNVVAVDAGDYFSLALKADGTVWAWGSNGYGQLGDGTFNDRYSPVQVSGLTGVVAIATGARHALAVRGDGTVGMWGSDDYFQFGDGSQTNQPLPVQMTALSGVTAVAAGDLVSMALKSDGTVWAWGPVGNFNTDSYIPPDLFLPAPVPGVTGGVAIATNDRIGWVLKSDGSVWTWRNDGSASGGGGGGGGSSESVIVAKSVSAEKGASLRKAAAVGTSPDDIGLAQVPGLANIVALSTRAGYRGSDFLALQSDGTVLQAPDMYSSPSPVYGVSGAIAIASGGNFDLVLKSDGTIRGWGDNTYNQLGDGGASVTTTVAAQSISAGAYHRLIETSNAVAWGWNAYGQVGDGTFTSRPTPVPVTGLPDYPYAVSAGTFHSLAIDSSNLVWAWGRGLLGDGVTTESPVPVPLAGVYVNSIAAGGTHSLAAQYGGVLAWGYNSSGQLGDGTTTDRSTPVHVAGLSSAYVLTVAAGAQHSVALGYYDGSVWTWGDNSSGQLGDGTNTNRSTAAQVSLGNGAMAIAAGAKHTLALTYDGSVWAWGENSSGQLGDGTTLSRSTPMQVAGLANVVAVAAGATHNIAIENDGSVWTWGGNAYGQLGDGTTVDRPVPVQVRGIANVVQVAAGATYTLVRFYDGSVGEWGDGFPLRFSFLGGTGGFTRAAIGLTGSLGLPPPPIRSAFVPPTVVSPTASNNYSSGQAFTLTTMGGDLQTALPGQYNIQPLAVLVWNAVGTGPLVNAPVVFNVANGGGGLAPTPASGASVASTLTVNTDATGIARAYYRQPALGNASSSITAALVNSQVTFSSRSVAQTLALGAGHTLALKGDGTVWAWGNNLSGQLGDGTTFNRSLPVQAGGLANVSAVAASANRSLALKSDGTVWFWGGAPGLATVATPTQVPDLANVAAIAASSAQLVALRADGTVWTASFDPASGALQPATQVAGLNSIIAIAAGAQHVLALRAGGVVFAWGSNASGQLGDGSTQDSAQPKAVGGLSDVTLIAAGGASSAALKADGTVWTWGANDSGQLGNGNTIMQPAPEPINGLAGITNLLFGDRHGIALRADGTVVVWGGNAAGHLADGTTTNNPTPVRIVKLFAVSAIAAGGSNNAVAKTDGTVVVWGDNAFGQSGDGTTASRLPPQAPSSAPGTTALAAGGAHNLALRSDGTVWAWGDNSFGQLGDGTNLNRGAPVQMVGITGATAVAAGNAHSLVLRSDGTVWAAGSNSSGQLGDGSTADRATLVPVPGLSGVIAIAAGNAHSLAVKSDGTVWAWGNNSVGQLGDGTTANRALPVLVAGVSGVSAIAAGNGHSVALKGDGTVWTWGNNFAGQLGDGTTQDRLVPTPVAGLNGVAGVAAGRMHSLAVKSDGTVWAWGSNSFGQLGDGTTSDRANPVQAVGLAQIVAVKAGGYHSIAVKNDGTIYTWGDNAAGQLARSAGGIDPVPAPLSGAGAGTLVAAGDVYSIGVAADGTILGWGDNAFDQLGIYSSQFVQAAIQLFAAPAGSTPDVPVTPVDNGNGTSDPDPTGAVRLQIYLPNP